MVLELTVFILSFNFCCWLARSCRENLSKPKAQLWTSSSWMKRRRHWIDHESAVEEIEDFLALTTRISFTLFLPRFSRSQLIFFFLRTPNFVRVWRSAASIWLATTWKWLFVVYPSTRAIRQGVTQFRLLGRFASRTIPLAQPIKQL